jgi:hypothetical protein
MGNNVVQEEKKSKMYITKTFLISNIEEFYSLSFSEFPVSLIFRFKTKETRMIYDLLSNLEERINLDKDFKLKNLYINTKKVSHNEINYLILQTDFFKNIFIKVFVIYELIQGKNKALEFNVNNYLIRSFVIPHFRIKTYLFLEFKRFLNYEFLFHIRQFPDVDIPASESQFTSDNIYEDIMRKVRIEEKNIDTYVFMNGKFWNRHSHFKDLQLYVYIIMIHLLEKGKGDFCITLNLSYKNEEIHKYFIKMISNFICSYKLSRKRFNQHFYLKFVLCDKSKYCLEVKEICEFNSKFSENVFAFLYAVHSRNISIHQLKKKVILHKIYSFLNGFLTFKRIEKVRLVKDYWFNNDKKLINLLTNNAYII